MLGLCLILIGACHPLPNGQGAPGALERQNGYVPPPEILSLTRSAESGWQLKGRSLADSRIRLTSDQGQAFGLTADGVGNFKAELEAGPNGHLYQLFMQDNDRLLPSMSRIFVPGKSGARAALLMEGGCTRPLGGPSALLETIDYDSGGTLGLGGTAGPGQEVRFWLGDQPLARAIADANGRYEAILGIRTPEQGELIRITAASGPHKMTRNIVWSAQPPVDAVVMSSRHEGEALRIDWRTNPGAPASERPAYQVSLIY